MSGISEFHSSTRLADDSCTVTSRDGRSVGPGNYLLSERRPAPAGAAAVASANPTMTYGVGYGNSSSERIDDESILRNHAVQTHTSRLTTGTGRVQPRPFLTIPLMSRGRGDPDAESRLIHPDFVRCGKECGGSVAEAPWPVFAPMNAILAENVQNPKNIIQESAAPGWLRSGLPSRQYARDNCTSQ